MDCCWFEHSTKLVQEISMRICTTVLCRKLLTASVRLHADLPLRLHFYAMKIFLLPNSELKRFKEGVKAFYIQCRKWKGRNYYLAIDDWWAIDIDRFSKQKISPYNLETIEKTTAEHGHYDFLATYRKIAYKVP